MIERLGVRQRTEALEEGLSPLAARSNRSRGRQTAEQPCPIRTAFQQDRDRIIYSKAFRRLKHKTQVFISPLGDHYVTRLTHALEVSQIARTVARALILNEDLAEAVSLGHDLGHTPFGHIGEAVLDGLCPGGFKHNEQSLRVVDLLENEGRGLNLTWEVRDGILNHTKGQTAIFGPAWGETATLEGDICKLADIVAYVNHDTGDAVRAGVLKEDELPGAVVAVLGRTTSERINALVSDIVVSSWGVTTGAAGKPAISMGPEVSRAVDLLREFLFERLYRWSSNTDRAKQAREVLHVLWERFVQHPEELPEDYRSRSDPPERKAADYIAGMTDQFALTTAEHILTGR